METILKACMVLLPFIYWCVDEKKGLRLATAALFWIWLNLVLKHAPLQFFFAVRAGTLIELLFWIITGAMILAVYFLLGKRLESLLAAGGLRAGIIAGVALSFIMILYRPSEEILMPAGMIPGLAAGYCLNRIHVGFTVSALFGRTGHAKYLTLAARYLAGIAVLFLLYFTTGKLNMVFTNSENYILFVFLRFALLAFWVSVGAPWLFRLLRLAGDDPGNTQD